MYYLIYSNKTKEFFKVFNASREDFRAMFILNLQEWRNTGREIPSKYDITEEGYLESQDMSLIELDKNQYNLLLFYEANNFTGNNTYLLNDLNNFLDNLNKAFEDIKSKTHKEDDINPSLLIQKRKELDITATELANQIGIEYEDYIQFETGHDVTSETLNKIKQYLNK